MIARFVGAAIQHKVLVLVMAGCMLIWGAVSYTQLPIEAYPDVMNTQVQVITQWPGHAAEEVEKLVTVPLESSLNGTPKLTSIRSRSLFGLSVVYLGFEDGVDDYFARQQILERVGEADIPSSVQPTLSPLASATGEIYRYTLVGAPLMDLKTIEDWTMERELKAVPGVADVSSFGGTIKQYQVIVDPHKLKQYDVSLKSVMDAVSAANANAGGSFIESGGEEYIVRGVGLFRSESDIRSVVVAEIAGTPIVVGDVADVRIGFQPRLGKVGWSNDQHVDVDDAVEGIVLLRRGENAEPVLEAIHKKIADLNGGRLPKGVQIKTFIDRTDLVHTTSHTVQKNLFEGMFLVVVVLLLFLRNLRASVIVALTIPFGLLFAFTCMQQIHVPANLLSLGAVDFGIIVNGSVIMVENIYRRLSQRDENTLAIACIFDAAHEVASEIVFTTVIIILAYLPLFTMQSVEKKMFSPMAYTIGFALIGSLIMALTVAPILCLLLLKGKLHFTDATWMEWLKQKYERTLEWALTNPLPTVTASVSVLILSILMAPKLGTEFLPHLDEGNLWVRATMPTTISYTEANRIVPHVRQIMSSFQPVRLVVSQLGRPDDGTDATGFYNAEFLVDLKPYGDWKAFNSKEQLIEQMNARLSKIPGVSFNFSQVIEDNVEEAVTGIKGELAVKLFGDDLDKLESNAAQIQSVLSKIPGVVDLDTFKETGEPQVKIEIDRAKIARYGLHIQDIEDLVEAGFGGRSVTQVLDGEKKFAVVVRLAAADRSTVDAIRSVAVTTPDDQRIPLGQLAQITTERGASFVYRESGRRFIGVKFGVRGRDIGGVVQEAQKKVQAEVKLPNGYYTVWGGEFESMQRAGSRLMLIVPITLILIFFVLYMLFDHISRAAMVMLNVPLALIGGIFALYLTHFHLSVAAAVGFIALFGVAVQNGVIMVSYIDSLREQGMHIREAVLQGAVTRLRPVLMTAILASIGLVPAAISTGIGSDTQKPLAIVIIGGLVSATLLTLVVLPVIYALISREQS